MGNTTRDWNPNTRQYEERDSAKAARTGSALGAAAAGRTSAAGLGSVKSKPWPDRKDFATEEEWQKAYDERRKEQLGGSGKATSTPKPVSSNDPMDAAKRALRSRYSGTLGSMGRA